MLNENSIGYKQKLEKIKKQLTAVGSKEANFLKIELLFYEAMETAREYGKDSKQNNLLDVLKDLQAGQYQETKQLFKKSSQREQVIKKFINRFKTVLSLAIKNSTIKEVL